MSKFIITFGVGQLPKFKGNPMDVMLVVEAHSEAYARDKVRATTIGNNFCESYYYTEDIVEELTQCGAREYTLEDLGVEL